MNKLLKDWTPKEIYIQIKAMKKLQGLFSYLGYDLVLGMGTLLGAIREGTVIPHDDDFDMFYISHKHTFKEALDEFSVDLMPELSNRGYTIKEIEWDHAGKKKMLGQWHLTKDEVVIDLWLCWIDENKKLHLTMFIDGTAIESSLLPLKTLSFYNTEFNIPKDEITILQAIYGPNWKIPQPKWKSTPNWCNINFLQKKILKVIDQYGWAYHFIAQEQQKYSVHQIDYAKLADLPSIKDLSYYDIIYFSSPGMGHMAINKTIERCQRDYNKSIKIIGGYAGEQTLLYKHVDAIVSISTNHIPVLKTMYPGKPIVFLPECVDLNYFTPNPVVPDRFVVGYAGRTSPVKRTHLLSQLKYPVKMQVDHGETFFVKERTLEPMREFYKTIDCLVLTSYSECTPRVVLEAMSCGLPVITTDVGSMPLLLGPEWLVPVRPEDDTVSTMNEKLDLLSSNPQLREAAGLRNRKQIETYFNWEKYQGMWDDIFNLVYLNKPNKEYVNAVTPYYKNFPTALTIDSENIRVPSRISLTGYEEGLRHFTKILSQKRILYCVVNKTCAEIVCEGVIASTPILIAIPDLTVEVITMLRAHGYTYNNNEFKNELATFAVSKEKLNTKIYTFKEFSINVPYPVISYLQNKNLWKKPR